MEDEKLLVSIYMNQKIVFDMLAILEDGFSNLTTVQKTATSENETSKGISGEIGTSNIFAFLGVKFGGGVRKESGKSEG